MSFKAFSEIIRNFLSELIMLAHQVLPMCRIGDIYMPNRICCFLLASLSRPLELDLINVIGRFSPTKFLQLRKMGIHKKGRRSPRTRTKYGLFGNDRLSGHWHWKLRSVFLSSSFHTNFFRKSSHGKICAIWIKVYTESVKFRGSQSFFTTFFTSAFKKKKKKKKKTNCLDFSSFAQKWAVLRGLF